MHLSVAHLVRIPLGVIRRRQPSQRLTPLYHGWMTYCGKPPVLPPVRENSSRGFNLMPLTNKDHFEIYLSLRSKNVLELNLLAENNPNEKGLSCTFSC